MTQGETMLSLVRNMQKLNGEIAALLKTFERLLSESGFRNDRGSTVTKDCSTSIDSPQYWAPPWMFRVLQNKRDRDDVIVLNIALDNPDEPDTIQEPLVLCARFRYQKGQAKKSAGEWDAWDLWFCKPPKELGRVYDIGDLKLQSEEFLPQSGWDKDAVQAMQDIRFLAVPLTSITDSKTLEKEVIRRIL